MVLNSGDGVRSRPNESTGGSDPGPGVSFAAGRMAFYAVLNALGVGSGDEVILPGFTCSVMPNAVWRTGARPVFADIEAGTFGSGAGGIAARITSRTKAVVAQHYSASCKFLRSWNFAENGAWRSRRLRHHLTPPMTKKVRNWGDAAIFSWTQQTSYTYGRFCYTNDERSQRCGPLWRLPQLARPPIPAVSTISSRTALLSAGELPPPPGPPVSGSLRKDTMGRREATGFSGTRFS
jgi:hypothetical protein